jgi:hypothetical protein
MNGKLAVRILLGICILLAVLLLTNAITPFASGLIFAAALVVFGGLSRDFRRGRG